MTTPLIALVVGIAAASGFVVWWLFRTLYGAPWYLLVGPTDAGKTTLVAGALETASPRKRRAAKVDSRDVAWHYFKEGVVIDVAGRLAFPPGGSDLSGWQRVLQLLTRYRPRRPLDGVILTVPARLFLEDDWRVRVLDLGAAVRERFVFAQGRLGFALPVYLVITQADQIRGFSAVTEALPDHLLQGMLGWSNPHAPDEPFAGAWVDEGMDSLHRSLVHTQVELLASDANQERASDLFLFSGAVRSLSAPLRALLDEIFRPGLYREGFFLRGFYLCGAADARRPQTVGDGVADVATLPLHLAPIRQVAFVGDLLDEKVFAERDLAIPLPEVVAGRQRSRLIAQVTCGLLALGLSAGMAWGYWQLEVVQGKFVQLLGASHALLAERLEPAGGAGATIIEHRLGQSLSVVDHYVQQLSNDRLSVVLFDASLERTLTRFLGSVVLEDVGAALDTRGGTWLDAAVPATTDPPPASLDIESSVRYKALADFAQKYALFVQNYSRFDTLATGRYQPADDPVTQLSALSQYLDYPLSLKTLAPRYARALRNARARRVPCAPNEVKPWRDRVATRAAALLDDFGTWSFGTQNPVWSSASDFKGHWESIWLHDGGTRDLESLMTDTAALSGAVTAWAKLDGRYGDQPIPLFAQAPFKRQPSPEGSCAAALSPDLSASIVRVTDLKDALRARLLAEQVDPFGSVLEDKEPGLVLADDVATLKAGLDALKRQRFWAPPPDEVDIALPGRPIWPAGTLNDVASSFVAFEGYRGQAFAGLPLEQRSALLAVVESQVAQLLATELALAAEDGTAPRTIDAVKDLTTQFVTLSPVVPLLKLDPIGGDILARLNAEAAEALRVIDRQAKTAYPWVFDQPAQTGVVYARWSTLQATYPPADAVKQWAAFADAQRDGIRAFASLAQPFVAYLDASSRGWDTSTRWAGVSSWAAISRGVTSDDQKLAASTQNALDAVIRDGVPSMVVDRGCAPAGGAAASTTSGFFITAGNAIMAEGQRVCRAQAQAAYAAVASAFNGTLQGKFPFLPAAVGAPEATPAEVKSFLEAYGLNHGPALRPVFDTWSCSEDARSFLRGIESASALLSSVLTPGLPAPAIVLDVAPDFTVDPALEGSGRDQIEEWGVTVGSKTYSDRLPAADPAPWTSGTPVSLALRFASDSPNIPTAGTGFLRIVGRDVRLQFGGAWALFQLLQVGRPAPADLLLQPDPSFNLLSFTIPVARDLSRPALRLPGAATAFTVYMRLKVSPRGKPDALRADPFPTRAPATVACPGS